MDEVITVAVAFVLTLVILAVTGLVLRLMWEVAVFGWQLIG